MIKLLIFLPGGNRDVLALNSRTQKLEHSNVNDARRIKAMNRITVQADERVWTCPV